jgi:tRNA 5-methylaminomethyl-2-thiouridine biosynthesis bifunctional protein
VEQFAALASPYRSATFRTGTFMNSTESPWLGAPPADLAWGEDGVPRSQQFEDVYYSSANGLDESRHVFLAGNQLPQQWRLLQNSTFTVVETGFGTGLNFLATWDSWRRSNPDGKTLHYLAIEKYPLRPADLERVHLHWPELCELSAELQANYPPPLPGQHRLLLDEGRVILDLVIDDIQAGLDTLADNPKLVVDAWYLDGFTPSRNPEMWSLALYQGMARLSRPGTSFATFTAASDVRRGLQNAGFAVNKTTGFGSKREMLQGHYVGEPLARTAQATPWHLSPAPQSAARTALVLGAGLGGATVAAALARRGWKVTVLEQNQVAGAASGNAQGVLYTRISHRQSALNDFALHSFCFAHRYYRQLLQSGQLREGIDGQFCGALHLRPDWSENEPLRETVVSLPGLANHLEGSDAEQVSGLAGCPGGLFYPLAGWMNPPAICAALLAQPGIELKEQCGKLRLQQGESGWQARDPGGAEIAAAEIAIIACGGASKDFDGLQWLPLQSIRGQVTHIPSRGKLASLQTVLCHDGYLPPARQGEHCIGASFDIGDGERKLRAVDHQHNLQSLHNALPCLGEDLPLDQGADLPGRVGFRTASPDYLPMVGAVPDFDRFCSDFADLRRNARQFLNVTGSHLPGLYLSTGHGSRGLTSTPLSAEILAAQISAEPWPVAASLYRALAPARFIIRDLARNRL